ncbi:MAG: FAD-dependent oxidoreductase [Fulvivirga sp.]
MATEHFYTKALWRETVSQKIFPILSEDIEVDVAIVGGGITGISTAYNLSKAGRKVAVLEAKNIGMGTTGSSTGNLYATTSDHLHNITSKFNDETMRAVAASRNTAVDFVEERIKEFKIDCEFERVPWFLFTTQEDTSQNQQVEKEFKAARDAGLKVSDEVPAGFPFDVSSMVHVMNQAQFNPLKYVQQLAAAINGGNCSIYENTTVIKIEDGDPCIVHTSQGRITAKKVVQATHTPKGIYAVHTAMEVYREYAFAVRLKGELPAGGVYWHLKGNQLYSIRPYSNEQGNFLIVLDGSQKVGHIEHTEDSFKHVEEYMRAHFDVDRIEFTWAAQNYTSADSLPFIGISPLEDNVYIATGFGPDGLTYGTLASTIISDLILGNKNQWSKLYNPKRFTPLASSKRFIKENIDVATHLVKDYLFTGNEKELKDIGAGKGEVVKIDGKKVAAYKDLEDQLHLVSAVCTHMGCIVHWNNGEKSWDCPCHGSRFSIDGEVLEGPAFTNLTK